MARKPHRAARDLGLAARNQYTLREMKRQGFWKDEDPEPHEPGYEDRQNIAKQMARRGPVDPEVINASDPTDTPESIDGNHRIAALFGKGGLSKP
jgi:hypothetical protein